jgi:hypothetical protein
MCVCVCVGAVNAYEWFSMRDSDAGVVEPHPPVCTEVAPLLIGRDQYKSMVRESTLRKFIETQKLMNTTWTLLFSGSLQSSDVEVRSAVA